LLNAAAAGCADCWPEAATDDAAIDSTTAASPLAAVETPREVKRDVADETAGSALDSRRVASALFDNAPTEGPIDNASEAAASCAAASGKDADARLTCPICVSLISLRGAEAARICVVAIAELAPADGAAARASRESARESTRGRVVELAREGGRSATSTEADSVSRTG
jgi:hypothetical protein